MDTTEGGNGWKYGLSLICLGIVCVMGMGVFSLVYHAEYKGEYCCLYTYVYIIIGDNIDNMYI